MGAKYFCDHCGEPYTCKTFCYFAVDGCQGSLHTSLSLDYGILCSECELLAVDSLRVAIEKRIAEANNADD